MLSTRHSRQGRSVKRKRAGSRCWVSLNGVWLERMGKVGAGSQMTSKTNEAFLNGRFPIARLFLMERRFFTLLHPCSCLIRIFDLQDHRNIDSVNGNHAATMKIRTPRGVTIKPPLSEAGRIWTWYAISPQPSPQRASRSKISREIYQLASPSRLLMP